MDGNFTTSLEEFMGSALVTWVSLFDGAVDGEGTGPLVYQYMDVNSNSHNALQRYLKLTSGIYLNEVMRIIDPNPKVEQIYRNVNEDNIQRVQNFSVLNRHLRSYYQENLQQLILMPLPNIAVLGRDPLTEGAVEELRRLLLLLLGCAVQCERKETFIQQIQTLDIEAQAAIALCIQEVTQDPRSVLPLQYGELCGLEVDEIQGLFSSMAKQIQSLLSQRDTHLEKISELCQERELSQLQSAPTTGYSDAPPEGIAFQLADNRAKLRRLKQELEEKDDQLLDYKQEIQTMEENLKKLQLENRTLHGEVRKARSLRDELDCLRERAAKAEQLQSELQSCKHRLRSLDLYRTQLKEQQQYCTTLQENKALLEEQLTDARTRCSALRELEWDNLLLRQKILEVEGERDTERQRVDELLEMNISLEVELKRSHTLLRYHQDGSHHFPPSEMESDEEFCPERAAASDSCDEKPLSVEVDEASTLRLLGAENENAELRKRLESLQAEQEASASKEELQRQIDKLTHLKEEHQMTLRELQNFKNENATLRKCLDQIKSKDQLIVPEKEEPQKEKTVIQRRGEGEGKDIRREINLGRENERRQDIIQTEREDGEGEEVHLSKEKSIKPKSRGEAEGEKGTRTEKVLTPSNETEKENWNNEPDDLQKSDTHEEILQKTDPISSLDNGHLVTQLQEALEEAERQAALAQDLHTKLGEQSRKAWEAEQKMVLLEAESQRLRRSSELLSAARKQIEELQSESLHMEEELTRLRSQVELQKMESVVISQLEGERAVLERDRETLKSTVETLRATVRKSDQLELTNQTLKADLERLGRSLESSRRREEELEAELRDAGMEAESLVRGRDQAMLDVSRLEQERETLQSQVDSHRREQRQREREVARLRQQLESTTSALEHTNQRACKLEAEHRRTCQEATQLREVCTKLQDLEREVQQLNVVNTEDKAQISSLTQELTSEKLHSQTLSSQVTELSQKLEISESQLRIASSLLPQQPEQTRKADKTDDKGMKPSAPSNQDSQPVPQGSILSSLPQKGISDCGPAMHREVEDRSSRDESLQSSPEQDNKLLFVERENALLQKEREVLQTQLSQSQYTCKVLREQLESLQHHSISLQENGTKLQALNTKLQVEQGTLSSQNATLWARCSESEARCAALEAESKVWAKEREESVLRTEALKRDHLRLTALQRRQEVEFEELLAKHSQLKTSSRSLEIQFKELEGRYQELLQRRTQLEEEEQAIREEREKVGREAGKQAEMEKEVEKLRTDNDRFQGQQKEWVQVQSELLAQGSVLRMELSAAQLERTRLEGEVSTLKEQNQHLDLNSARLNSQFQLLTQLKANMEEENRHLVEQNQALSRENRALLEKTLESREEHHTQQREYLDKLNELRREKQKLVEKIMDQYRVLEPNVPTPTKAKKTNWIADRMKKLIKPRGGREGRVNFVAAGSVENLAEAGDIVHHSPSTTFTDKHNTPPPQDPRSAPVSPTPLRRISSQDTEDPSKRSGRRKLGSRHGWALGRGGRGGAVTQSFSPGDQIVHPREWLRSTRIASTTTWEAEASATPSQDSLSEEGKESEESLSRDVTADRQSLSSGAEDGPSTGDKSLDLENTSTTS
ncbi:coiled-coil domain containing 88A isoform X2 [Denticeps clupeoides]|uniref:HOOK N-terminal domain-containing protein n=1 Tax=Denticeps clupeoides TaxID=299321 RepID=A0AAY4CHG7_9TELE|nr:girdin-like isoform X2 [Denticeps clupeoides]